MAPLFWKNDHLESRGGARDQEGKQVSQFWQDMVNLTYRLDVCAFANTKQAGKLVSSTNYPQDRLICYWKTQLHM